MPEAGRLGPAQYERGVNNLPKGAAQQANQGNQMADSVGLIPEDDGDEYSPSAGAEEFIFGATDRPNEPVTSGAPVGAGLPGSVHAYTNDQEFAQRLGMQLAQAPDPEVQRFAKRLLRGE